MIRASIAILGIASCFVLPGLIPTWNDLNAPKLKVFLLGAFIAFALIATVISSTGIGAEFVYVSF